MKEAAAQLHEPERRKRIARILNAARKLFLKKGYRPTTIRDICRASRLSNGTVYFYFKNKDAIYAHIYEECFQFLIDMMEQSRSDDMPPFEQIETVLKTYLKYFIEHRELWEMQMNGSNLLYTFPLESISIDAARSSSLPPKNVEASNGSIISSFVLS